MQHQQKLDIHKNLPVGHRVLMNWDVVLHDASRAAQFSVALMAHKIKFQALGKLLLSCRLYVN